MNTVKIIMAGLMFVLWVVIVFGCCLANDVHAQSNDFYVGVVINLSANAKPDFGSLRPWVKLHIDNPTPNAVNRFRVGEAHHLYAGIAAFAVGQITNVRLLRVMGGVLIVDDVLQHTLRVDSPIHMLSDRLYQHGWYRSLVKAGSNIFGQDK